MKPESAVPGDVIAAVDIIGAGEDTGAVGRCRPRLTVSVGGVSSSESDNKEITIGLCWKAAEAVLKRGTSRFIDVLSAFVG